MSSFITLNLPTRQDTPMQNTENKDGGFKQSVEVRTFGSYVKKINQDLRQKGEKCLG